MRILSRILKNDIKFTEKARAEFKAQAEREHHADKLGDTWKKVAIYGSIPIMILLSVNAWRREMAHLAHPHKPDTEYEYMFIRKKPFPWGEGKKSFFHSEEHNHIKGQ